MARNLWKVIQKQEKKIEELESIVAALQMKVSCLEARDVKLVPYKYPDFDKFNDKDWWRNQPVMASRPDDILLKKVA